LLADDEIKPVPSYFSIFEEMMVFCSLSGMLLRVQLDLTPLIGDEGADKRNPLLDQIFAA
jgi:hypothetical protein